MLGASQDVMLRFTTPANSVNFVRHCTFTFKDLEQNRDGRLSTNQLARIRRRRLWLDLFFGLWLIGVAGLIVYESRVGTNEPPSEVVCTLGLAMGIIGWLVRREMTMKKEHDNLQVQVIPIHQVEWLGIEKYSDKFVPDYILLVDREKFTVKEAAYNVLRHEATEAIYIAKHTRTVVAAE